MPTYTYSSPVRKVYGEQVSLSTTATHTLFRPDYNEVLVYCSSAWRMGLAPALRAVVYYNGSKYINYTIQAIDRVSTTHVPLDAMATTHYLYLGLAAPTRGFYFTVDGTNKNTETASLDVEYCYEVASAGYQKISGTVSGTFTVGETVLGGTSKTTAIAVYDDGSGYLVVKNVGGRFMIGETLTGITSAQTVTAITQVVDIAGAGFFTDVAADSDGTATGNATLYKSGLYAFTLPSVVPGVISELSQESLHWFRFAPSATLSATVDAVDIIPACDTTNYGYMEGGINYQFALSTQKAGAFELYHASTGTLDLTWIQQSGT